MAKKLIDLSNLQKLVNVVLRPKIDSKQPKIVTATINTAAATAAKTCTIADYTPAVGDILMLTFLSGNSVSSPTLNINGLGAKNIVLGSTNATTTTLSLGPYGVAMVVVGDNKYQLFGSHRTVDNDTVSMILMKNNSGRTIGYNDLGYIKDGQYVSIYASGTVPSLVKRTDPIDLFSTFVTCNSAPISNGSSGSFTLNTYNSSFINSLNGFTLTAYQPLYLVGSLNVDGKFVIDNTSLTSHFTQTLPTSVNNKIYVELGYATDTTKIAFIPVKRWLTYVNGLGIVDLYREGLSKKVNLGTISSSNSLAVGTSSRIEADAPYSTAIGNSSYISDYSYGSVAIGYASRVATRSGYSLAIGSSSRVEYYSGNSIAIGSSSYVEDSSPNSIVIGTNSNIAYETPNTISIGNSNYISGYYGNSNSIAIGSSNYISSSNSIAIGNNISINSTGTGWIGDYNLEYLYRGTGTNSSFNTTSDERIKENIEDADLDKCLDSINRIKVRRFNYKDFVKHPKDKHVTGFIAQEFKEVFPKAVNEVKMKFTVKPSKYEEVETLIEPELKNDKGKVIKEAVYKTEKIITSPAEEIEFDDLLTLDTSQLIYTLVGAIQKLDQKNSELEERITLLENKK